MQKPSIIVNDLFVRTQEDTVLEGISFSLLPHDHLAVLGNSGSGKTTLVKAISGKVHFLGKMVIEYDNTLHPRIELTEQRYSFKNLSGINDFYYQQRFNSFDANNAPTILQELLKTFSVTTDEDNNRQSAESALETLGIGHLKDTPLIQLSSGEHKRFQLAKALLNPPQLLILDTPYTGLDVSSVKKLNTILSDISKKGTQIILIPGTFSIPDFITHTAFLENKKLKFFGEKGNIGSENFIEEEEPVIPYDKSLLPISDGDFPFDTVVEMKNVTIEYGDHLILQNLNWKIKCGERWLLKGPNGAGKSSLLSMITGDHPQAYSNEIYLFEKRRGSGESIWDIKQKTGYISPELHAYFDKNITCFQAIGSGYFDTIGLFKRLTTTQYNNILQWLDFLQLSHVSTKPLHSISASLQRMILLARALVKNPPLLVLDEPCQGLDLKQSRQFTSLIDHICLRSMKTMIYVSHDESNVPGCVQKVLQLEKGGYQIYSVNKQILQAEVA
ncbi:MAG: ATP-binding cassette domain-containing protein [Ginsengibacter sp.]